MRFSTTASIDSDISILQSLVLMKQKQEKTLQTVNHKQRSLGTKVNDIIQFQIYQDNSNEKRHTINEKSFIKLMSHLSASEPP